MANEKIKEIIKQIFKEKIEIEIFDEASFDTDLISLGLNSLTFIKLLVSIETRFDIEFEEEFLDFNYLSNLNQLVDYIAKNASF